MEVANNNDKSLVNYGDILAAVRAKHGGHVNIIDYDVELATKSVQGFTSLMLRVTVKISDNDEIKTSKLIVKRPPQLPQQLALTEEIGIFKREKYYFNDALPILNKVNSNLVTVKAYVAHEKVIIMEDLSELGFTTLGSTGQEAVKLEYATLEHARLAIRKLAELHAASLDQDWHKIIGKEQFDNDPFFAESDAFLRWIDGVCLTMQKVINILHPEINSKYITFFHTKNIFNVAKKYISKDENTLNVLLHGDFWLNNMMFKHDPETKKPIAIKFFDLQIFRFAPPSRDILYFLYFCFSKQFRENHEREIIETYVNAFNTYAARTPDIWTVESFYQEYDSNRMFGLIMALLLRTTFFLEDVFPGEGEHFSEESYKEIMDADHVTQNLNQFRKNPGFKKAYVDIVDEVLLILDKQESEFFNVNGN